MSPVTGLPQGEKRYEKDKTVSDISKVSEASIMTKVPSKCPTCKLDLPSISALKSHKAQAHPTPSKPPGPPLKAKDAKKKTTPGKAAIKNNNVANMVNVGASTSSGIGADSNSPRANVSAGPMDKWVATSKNKEKDTTLVKICPKTVRFKKYPPTKRNLFSRASG